MDRVGLLVKSYAGDAALVDRLMTSYRAFNAEGLALHLVVPRSDRATFAHFVGEGVTLHDEEAFADCYVDEPVHGLRPGYINQQIVKLAFWESGLLANYFCVDSDAVFVRPFGEADFMRDESTPYSVLVEDNELKVEPSYYRDHWVGREAAIRRIMAAVGLDDPVMRTCHGHQVMSSAVLRSLRDDFLAPRGWSYADALRDSPYEFSWYCMWLQKSGVIPIHAREPLVKVFHNEGQQLEYILRGVTEADIARGYLALVVNSNYARAIESAAPDASKVQSLAPHLSYGEAVALLAAKLQQSLRRLR